LKDVVGVKIDVFGMDFLVVWVYVVGKGLELGFFWENKAPQEPLYDKIISGRYRDLGVVVRCLNYSS